MKRRTQSLSIAGDDPFVIRAWMAFACALTLAVWLAGCDVRSKTEPHAGESAGGVTHVRIEGELDAGTLGQIKRAIEHAHDAGHDRLIIEIDTPGGSIDLMWKIAKLLRDAASKDLLLVAWVHDHAVSAGVLIALACDRIYMTPQASIGSAMPVTIGPEGLQALPQEGGVRQKVTSALRGQFRAMAEKQKRPPALAEAMVDEDVAVYQVKAPGEPPRLITGDEWDDLRASGNAPDLVRTIVRRGELLNLSGARAVELGFADGLADNFQDVLEKIGSSGVAVVHAERARSDDFLVWLDRLSPLLLIAGLVLAYVEIKMPGFGLPGILSLVCFALLLAGRWLAGLADVPHFVAVAAGAILIAIEVFLFPGTLWLGITGILLVVGGLIFASVGPGFGLDNPLDQRLILDASFNLIACAFVAVLAAFCLSRFLPRTPLFRRLVLMPAGGAAAFAGALPEASGARSKVASIGALGRALTDLRPVGKVVLDRDASFEFEARAQGPLIARGARVRVIETSAGRLVVDAVDEHGEGS